MRRNISNYLSEFVGTFALVFAGTGAIIINDVTRDTLGNIGIAVVFGLIIMMMIDSLGDVSGAHFNPAVTVGFWIAKRFPLNQVLPYITAQLTGGIFASLILKRLFGTFMTLGATLPIASASQAFTLEVIITFFLMFVILSVSTGSKEKGLIAGLSIGGAVALGALIGGPVTGASMNPARSLAPALVSGYLHSLWIYLTAPFLGSALAVLIYKTIHR
jgi:aquaporin NIP